MDLVLPTCKLYRDGDIKRYGGSAREVNCARVSSYDWYVLLQREGLYVHSLGKLYWVWSPAGVMCICECQFVGALAAPCSFWLFGCRGGLCVKTARMDVWFLGYLLGC